MYQITYYTLHASGTTFGAEDYCVTRVVKSLAWLGLKDEKKCRLNASPTKN